MNAEYPLLVAAPPVLVTLATGLIIAFAVQLLLTSFGVALGVTALGYLPGSSDDQDSSDSSSESSQSGAIGKVGFAVGAGTLLTVNTVLFVACFLAVKLSLVNDVILGAVLGVVIWSGYFLVVAWVSSKAAGSVMGAIASTITAGMQGLMSTVIKALQKQDSVPKALRKQIATTDSALDTIQKQLDSTVSANDVQAIIQTYVSTLQPPKLDLQEIRAEVAKVLSNSDLKSLKSGLLPAQIDRQALLELISSRTDFSKQDVNQVVDALESTWQEVVDTDDIISFVKSASPDALTSDELNKRIEQLRHAQFTAAQPTTKDSAIEQPAIGHSATEQLGLMEIPSVDLKQMGKQLFQTVLQRVDLSDLDVSRILTQFQTLTSSADSPANQPTSASFSPIKTDVENYLLTTYPWHLTRKTVKIEFKEVLYDPDANPIAVRQQILPLDRDFFVAQLEQRDDLTPAKVNKIADRLEEVRQDVLDALQIAEAEEQSKAFTTQVADYLRIAQPPIKLADLQQQIKTRLQETESNIEHWNDRLHHLTPKTLTQMLNDRQDLSQKQLEELIEQLEIARDRLLTEVKELQEQIREAATTLWFKLEQYVSDRSQKLTARTIQRQLKTLIKDSKVDPALLQAHLPAFDRATVESWIRDRQDLSDKQIKRATEQLAKAWSSLTDVSKAAVADTQVTADRAMALLTDYLQEKDWSTFQLADLPQDLLSYLQRQKVGVTLLSQLALVDWGELFEPFQQRQDLSQSQRQQILRQVQQTLYTVGKLPRRLALRTKTTVQTVQQQLTDYLRSADRDELNSEQIQRALTQLLTDASASLLSTHADSTSLPPLERLRSHLPELDRSRLVALLAERGDLAEAEIDQIVEQTETILQQTTDRMQTAQQQAQQAIAASFAKLRDYLATLALPELDYDRIKQEVQQLLINPQAGLDALGRSIGDTLSHSSPEALNHYLNKFNRESLSTLLKARDDLSESLVQQITDRVDAVRLTVLDQVNTLQQSAQQQMETLKQQARHQAEETRKAIATAAWWLFITALTSVASSAIAGALAVGGLGIIVRW